MKLNLIINGLETSAKQETEVDYMELCIHFFQTIMEIEEPIPMIMTHCMGPQSKDGTKAMVVRLQSPQDKSVMFQHVKALTGKKNSKGSLYFIYNQLPEGCNEVRRQLQAIVTENRKQPANARMEMKLINNDLVINSEVHHHQVSTPTPTDLLKISSQSRTKVHTIDLKYSNTETHKASRFIGVAHAMKNIADVCEGYHKVKTL